MQKSILITDTSPILHYVPPTFSNYQLSILVEPTLSSSLSQLWPLAGLIGARVKGKDAFFS